MVNRHFLHEKQPFLTSGILPQKGQGSKSPYSRSNFSSFSCKLSESILNSTPRTNRTVTTASQISFCSLDNIELLSINLYPTSFTLLRISRWYARGDPAYRSMNYDSMTWIRMALQSWAFLEIQVSSFSVDGISTRSSSRRRFFR